MRLKLAMLLAALVVLSGCSGSADDASGASQGTKIKDAQVQGTDGATSTGSTPVVIDASQGGGLFTLEHSASTSTQVYRVEWYISTDAALSSDDKLIFGRNCGAGAGDCAGASATFQCVYDNSVETVCQDGQIASDTTNLSEYFGQTFGLPAIYVLMLRVCDGLFSDCVVRRFSAEFH